MSAKEPRKNPIEWHCTNCGLVVYAVMNRANTRERARVAVATPAARQAAIRRARAIAAGRVRPTRAERKAAQPVPHCIGTIDVDADVEAPPGTPTPEDTTRKPKTRQNARERKQRAS